MLQGATHHPSRTAVDAVAFPPLTGHPERQVRGTTCVWNGVVLTPGRVFDLNPRTTMRAGEPLCEQCDDEAGECETGRGPYRHRREARR